MKKPIYILGIIIVLAFVGYLLFTKSPTTGFVFSPREGKVESFEEIQRRADALNRSAKGDADGLKSFESVELGFILKYPVDWQILPISVTSERALIWLTSSKDTSHPGINFEVISYDVESLEAAKEMAIERCAARLLSEKEGCDLAKYEGPTNYNGKEVLKSYGYNDSGTLNYVSALLLKNGKAYNFTQQKKSGEILEERYIVIDNFIDWLILP